MTDIDKRSLSERDICTKYITPAIKKAGWNLHTQVREEFFLTNGRVIVDGQTVSRGTRIRADYVNRLCRNPQYSRDYASL